MLAIAASGFAAHSPSSSTITMNILRFSDLCAQGKVRGQRVFIRADLNVPLDDQGKITEDTRIRASLPCIRMALDAGAAVMVTSHLGRPTEGSVQARRFAGARGQALAELLGRDVPLLRQLGGRCERATGPGGAAGKLPCQPSARRRTRRPGAQAGCAVRYFRERRLRHCPPRRGTTYGIAQYAPIACAGPLLSAEIDALTKALAQPQRPLAAIVAGSKVSTKLTILQSLADKVDQLIVGGGIANTFMLAAGLPIGKSLAEPALWSKRAP
jgi:phosphoglycerate kinase